MSYSWNSIFFLSAVGKPLYNLLISSRQFKAPVRTFIIYFISFSFLVHLAPGIFPFSSSVELNWIFFLNQPNGVNDDDAGEEWRYHTFKNKLRVLLVDDGEVEQWVWKRILEILAVESVAAKNGMEAVNLFSAGERFDLVVIDKHMPIMDGVETIRRLRFMGVSAKIVGVGTSSGDEDRQGFLDVGIDDYVDKPIWPAQFVSWLQEIDDNY